MLKIKADRMKDLENLGFENNGNICYSFASMWRGYAPINFSYSHCIEIDIETRELNIATYIKSENKQDRGFNTSVSIMDKIYELFELDMIEKSER